jgi:hypothetical protein
MILSVSRSLTGIVFLPLPLSVLWALLLLHRLLPLLLSGTIALDIYVVLGHPLLFVMAFWEMPLSDVSLDQC